MIRILLILLVLVTAFTENVTAKDQSDIKQLELRLRRLEIRSYQADLMNGAMIEMLCKENHSEGSCREIAQKALKTAMDRTQNDAKELFGTEYSDVKLGPSKITIADKWNEKSLWRTKIKRNLTREQVRSIFGEPDKIEVLGSAGDYSGPQF